jgi:hypothetical protein
MTLCITEIWVNWRIVFVILHFVSVDFPSWKSRTFQGCLWVGMKMDPIRTDITDITFCFHISVRIRIRIWIVLTMPDRIWLDIIINMWFEQARLRGGCRQCDSRGPMALGAHQPMSICIYTWCIWQPIQFSSSSSVCTATLPIRESQLRGIPWQRAAASLRPFRGPGSEFPIPMSSSRDPRGRPLGANAAALQTAVPPPLSCDFLRLR